MLVLQIAAGVVLGVIVLAWLDQWGRRRAEEQRHAAQERIWAREAILQPMVTEVYKWFSRESSAYHGHEERPTPATPLQQIIADEMERRRAKMPGVDVPGAWKTTDMMERAAKYVAEDLIARGYRIKGIPYFSEDAELETVTPKKNSWRRRT
jgi:hypothetical protein